MITFITLGWAIVFLYFWGKYRERNHLVFRSARWIIRRENGDLYVMDRASQHWARADEMLAYQIESTARRFAITRRQEHEDKLDRLCFETLVRYCH